MLQNYLLLQIKGGIFMGKLENFLNNPETKTCYDKFCEVVGKKLKSQVTGKGLVTYKFDEQVNIIISGFLKNYKELILKLGRDSGAEKEYLEKIKALKSAVDEKGIEDNALCNKIRTNFDKVHQLFDYMFKQKLLAVSIVEQYEKRYQIRIEKYPFPEDETELIYQGLFLMMILHKVAKKEEALRAEEDMKEDLKEESNTTGGRTYPRNETVGSKAKKREPKNKHLDSVYNNPTFYFREMSCPFEYVGNRRMYNFNLDSGVIKDAWAVRILLDCYTQDYKNTDEITDSKISDFARWVTSNKRYILNLIQFREEVQEGPHEILITEDNINKIKDPFVDFLLQEPGSMLSYPYFFKGSEKKELSVKGRKFSEIKGYTYPKGVDVFDGWQETEELDKQLKPVRFRDATQEDKGYKKISMENLHELVKEYLSLLAEPIWKKTKTKVIKYISITYQCKRDCILVSFKTSNFELPPVVTSEDEFKKLFEKNRKRVLYRGLVDSKEFEDMKKRGVSYNARNHHEQRMGPGVYWSDDPSVAEKYGSEGVVAMALACEDLPKAVLDVINPRLADLKIFLMRDNQCLVIRDTAMCNAISKPAEWVEDEKKKPENKNIRYCRTPKEVYDWLNCT